MTDKEQKIAAKKFAEEWKDKGYEKGQSQPFWITLLRNVYGVEEPEKHIIFEEPIKNEDSTNFIDGKILSTEVLIEQKSIDKDLRKPVVQSDGTKLTPFQQAKKYALELPRSEHPRWIVTCNFKSFLIYDMEHPTGDPEEILLENLPKEYYRLSFLIDSQNENIQKEQEISIKAGEIVGRLYDEILELYDEPIDSKILKSLNMLCVRLVFCLYAEDSGLFGKHAMFYEYLKRYEPQDLRRAIIELFKVLNQKAEDRKYLPEYLDAFPYVNGGLFEDENIEIPMLNQEIKDLLLINASKEFDWSEISPTIFGAVFESTLNPETRRSGGMHYTSVENIHKLIEPLFLKNLKNELNRIKRLKDYYDRKKQLKELQEKISKLKFLDPACGSGNFLTETYLSLRYIENEILKSLTQIEGQIGLGHEIINPIQVSINQFYGIEINDFAVTVGKTALWIAEHQMMRKTEEILLMSLKYLPLKTYANIIEGNALEMDWNNVISTNELDYIMGNPPFVGARMMAQGSKQKQEVEMIFGNITDVQDLDYVTCWYKKAAMYIQNTKIEVGLVATNSICQGSQVPILWNVLLNEYNICINFAYQTFRWNSETTPAAVYCVIIGFATFDRKNKILYSSAINKGQTKFNIVTNINPYLLPVENSFVIAQKEALYDVPKMNFGNQPRDGGHFVISVEEREEILKREPTLDRWLHLYIGAEEFINKKARYCLWLKNATPSDIKQSKILYAKVNAVREFRENSKAKTTNGYARVPHLFAQITQPEGVDYIIIPRVSSERRKYIPIGFMNANIISSDAVQIIPNATLYHFGILTSNVHMAWMRTVAGRLKSDYRYSKELVYNTFPWINPTKEQKTKIEKTARAILEARKLYKKCSLAELYDEVTMPRELRIAHQNNDRAVQEAYGFPVKNEFTETDGVARLIKMYEERTKKK